MTSTSTRSTRCKAHRWRNASNNSPAADNGAGFFYTLPLPNIGSHYEKDTKPCA